jgi:site-specific recombinase XerD
MMLCYGAGLRISEAVALKTANIDSARMVLHIENGKGNQPRLAALSPRLLTILRQYWRAVRPQGQWLFPSWRTDSHLSQTSVQTACRDAMRVSGLTKRVTPHTLRHSFATHLLEGGEDIRVIQILLGHKRIESTTRYATVTPALMARTISPLDTLGTPPVAPTTPPAAEARKRGRPRKQPQPPPAS